MTDISIACLLHNAEESRAGSLDKFFRHIAQIEKRSGVSTERVVLVDDRTTDRTVQIAQRYCTPALFHFEDFSQARNLLLERAQGEWIFLAEDDMRYRVGVIANFLNGTKRLEGYKCVETFQRIVHPDRPAVDNLYYLLLKKDPSVRFQGLVFESLRIFPHELDRDPIIVGDHYMQALDSRMTDARPLVARELQQLDAQKETANAEESYWIAMRYNELGLMDCLPKKKMDKVVVSLLERAIALKEDFGPAYFELAKQHLFMQRNVKALQAAKQGYDKSGYKMCLDLFN